MILCSHYCSMCKGLCQNKKHEFDQYRKGGHFCVAHMALNKGFQSSLTCAREFLHSLGCPVIMKESEEEHHCSRRFIIRETKYPTFLRHTLNFSLQRYLFDSDFTYIVFEVQIYHPVLHIVKKINCLLRYG